MISTMGVFLLLFLVALLIGNFALRFFRCVFHDRNEELIFSYGLGIIFLSWMVLAAGITGHLTRQVLWIGIVLLGGVGSLQIPHILGLLRKREKENSDEGYSRWLQAIFWLVALWIGIRALTPIFGSDALAYHLSCPKDFLQMKRVDWIPNDMNSLFPFFMEMLFTLGLALGNEAVAQLFHWSLGVLLALSLTSFFFRFFGSKKWGWVAGLFFLLTPGVFNEMRTALADVAWSAYGFLSFYALFAGIPKKLKGWLCLSAIFLGAACGIKYLAGLSVLSTFSAFLVLSLRSGWKPDSIFRWMGVMGVGIVLVSGYWYFKAFRVYGNPVYPYFNPFFGLEPLIVDFHSTGDYAHKAGMGRGLLSFFLLPFHLTFFPTRFDGWAEQLGPAYLIFFPFVFWGERTGLRLALGLYTALFIGGWFWLAQVTRFLYPTLPFLVLLIMSGFYFFYRDQKKSCVFYTRMLSLVLLMNGFILAYHSRESFAYLTGIERKESFLEKRERSYRPAKFINKNLPLNAKIFNYEEPRMFYFNRALVRESFYRFRTKYDQTSRLDEIVERLKREGFTHILIANKVDKKEQTLIKSWVDHDSSDKRLDRIYQSRFQERDGSERRYTLYRIR